MATKPEVLMYLQVQNYTFNKKNRSEVQLEIKHLGI